MGIGTALNISLTGLKANQAQLDTTAANIANAGTAGYSRKRITTTALVAQESVLGVSTGKVERELDTQVQRQWRISVANAEYAAVRANSLGRLDNLIGAPDDPGAVTNVFNALKQHLERLATSPEDATARNEAAASAEALAGRIRSLSEDIQTLRQEAESSIGAAVREANGLLERISQIDKQVVAVAASSGSTAALQDERDKAIDRLSELMDIRVEEQEYGAVAIYTTNGTLLYDDVPIQMSFDERGTILPTSLYSLADSERAVGTVRVSSGPSSGVDFFADDTFRSGAIAAYRELRDETLVDAQRQLDELAAQLSKAMSTRTTAGTPVAGPPTGFTQNLSSMSEGDTLSFRYGSPGQTLTIVNARPPQQVGSSFTPDPNDAVVAVDFSDTANLQANILAALPSALSVAPNATNVAYNIGTGDLTITSTGYTITSLDRSETATGLQSGSVHLPLFVDGATGTPFTGVTNGVESKLGLAARLTLNPAIKADPSKLVLYGTGTPASDSARPREIIKSLTGTNFSFGAGHGIGSENAPFTGTVEQFLKQVVSSQGSRAEQARSISEGQRIVTANLEERYVSSREVDLDQELAMLIELQTAYQANARVLSAAREMIDALMRM